MRKRLDVFWDRSEIENKIGCAPEDINENAIAFIFDKKDRWIVEFKDGTFWTVAYNEDEIFIDSNNAFKWLKSRL